MPEYSRRELMKSTVVGLGALALSGGATGSCTGLKPGDDEPLPDEFWRRVDEVGARGLIDSILDAARNEVASSRALAASRRAAVLRGEGAGRAELAKAEADFAQRNVSLRRAKGELARLAGGLDESQRGKASQTLAGLDLERITDRVRGAVVDRLIVADVTPEEAQRALRTIDARLEGVAELRSLPQLVGRLDGHLDRLLAERLGNPSLWRDLCIFILVITSMYIAIVIAAILAWVLVCALTLGFVCEEDGVQQILDDMIDDTCGPA